MFKSLNKGVSAPIIIIIFIVIVLIGLSIFYFFYNKGRVIDSFPDETKIWYKENLIVDTDFNQVKLLITKALTISAGNYHACATLSNKTIKCWGRNTFGQLGDGTNIDKRTPTLVLGVDNANAVSVGDDFTCATLSNGTIKCWGRNNYGQLGDGTNIDKRNPVLVTGIDNAVSVSAGNNHACALLSNGKIKCWGFNGAGQLGDGTNIDKRTPTFVSGIDTAVSVSAGFVHTCAVLANGKTKCWGGNQNGQLGDGTTINKNIPTLVSNIGNSMTGNVIMVSAGDSHTCATVEADNTIRCWGDNDYGQLGDGTNNRRETPILVSEIRRAASVVAGDYFTCAVLSDGSMKCWGTNEHGQLGDGTNNRRRTPVLVSEINDAISATAGWYFSCAILSNGITKCWGQNDFGQLGLGDEILQDKNIPVIVEGLKPANYGYLVSTNVLLDKTVANVHSFHYKASSIPSGCNLKIQFSQNRIDWYNSRGNIEEWDYLSQGNHSIDLSSLGWLGPNFFYKIRFESDLKCIPVLDEISVEYHKYRFLSY